MSEAPTSFSQQRLWFLDQLEPGSPVYNIARAIRISGNLHVGFLERALQAIVGRHESLRTTFTAADGDPVQVVHPPHSVPIPVTSLDHLTEAQRQAQIWAIIAEESRRPFDLTAGPLMRARVLRLSPGQHIFLVSFHHIVTDGWSMSLFFEELGGCYEALCRDSVPALPELPVQYSDFARWQRASVTGEQFARGLEFWKRALDGVPAVLELPADRCRPSIQSHEGSQLAVALDPGLAQRLRGFAKAERVTLFMVLLAAFETLLFRYTGADDFVVGTPVAGRDQVELEPLIGFFVNTLPLRANLAGNPDFRELLQRVKTGSLEALTHQDIPFEKIVEALEPDRRLSHSPLFQAMFLLQNTPPQILTLPGARTEDLEFAGGVSKFDLTLEVIESDSLACRWEYSTALFDEKRIARMAEHFEVLLRGILENPGRRLSDLPILGAEERRRVLVDWNQTQAEYPRETCIHRAFSDRARKCPVSAAIFDDQRRITFGELDEQANRLANYLRGQGVEPGMTAGVFIERGADAVVALLAILKAGASYVPIDPGYPKQRIAFMLEDSRIGVLITRQPLRTRLPEYSGKTVFLDRDQAAILAASPLDPQVPVSAEDPAYIIYTSGSTGTPKGVVATHRASLNRFAWMWREYPFEAGEVCAHRTTLSFVDSIWEIFGPLLGGCPISVVSDETARDPEQLIRHLAVRRITRIVLVPSQLDAMLESGDGLQARLPHLRVCVSSGEALPYSLYERCRALLPHVALINLYGSSEVAADVTCFDTRTPFARGVVPMGRPISNVRIYILDKFRNPVPIGVPGEIYAGGDCLALGYFQRPEWTAERFPEVSFGGAPERLYRSGDLGRFRDDGMIEFLGRADNQVKLRGMRIEPGEIEAQLLSHAAIRQACVLVREDGTGPRLVAYVALADGQAVSPPELRRYLQARVPEFMVPSVFMVLESLRRTPNGKIDRISLPAPDAAAAAGLENSYLAPRNPTEETLAGIWSEVLKVGRVGVLDNFFDLRGHSLLAIRVIARIRRSLAVDVPVRALFEDATVAGLAAAVEAARASGAVAGEPIVPRRAHETAHEQLLARLKELPEDQIQALLEAVLAPGARRVA